MSTSPVSCCWMMAGARPFSPHVTRATASSLESSDTDGHPLCLKRGLDVTHGELAGVEHGCRQDGVCAGAHGRGEVRCLPRTAGGDHRDAGDLPHEADELEVEAVLRAVGVDGVDQQLAGAALDRKSV